MPTRTLTTLLGAAALALSVATFGAPDARAQGASVTQPVKPTPPHKPSAQKKAPGKTCGDLTSNTQAHKDCIAKQAHTGKKAKKTS